MLKYVVFVFILLIIPTYCNTRDLDRLKSFLRKRKPAVDNIYIRWPKFKYEKLYKNFEYRQLSDNAKEIFFAIGIHPSCKQKNGACIRRAKCVEKKMLYISRVCYTHDLVCCYDDYPPPNNPLVRDKEDNEKKEELTKQEDNLKGKSPKIQTNDNAAKADSTNMTKTNDTEKDKVKEADIQKDSENKNTTLQSTEKKALRIIDSENTETSTSFLTAAVLLPVDNSSAYSFWLVSNVTKEDILENVNSSIKVNELNMSQALQEFPQLKAIFDNVKPEPISTNVTLTPLTAVANEKELELDAVDTTTKKYVQYEAKSPNEYIKTVPTTTMSNPIR